MTSIVPGSHQQHSSTSGLDMLTVRRHPSNQTRDQAETHMKKNLLLPDGNSSKAAEWTNAGCLICSCRPILAASMQIFLN